MIVTAKMIDAAAKAIREHQQSGKRLRDWADTDKQTKRKWLTLAELALNAAMQSEAA